MNQITLSHINQTWHDTTLHHSMMPSDHKDQRRLILTTSSVTSSSSISSICAHKILTCVSTSFGSAVSHDFSHRYVVFQCAGCLKNVVAGFINSKVVTGFSAGFQWTRYLFIYIYIFNWKKIKHFGAPPHGLIENHTIDNHIANNVPSLFGWTALHEDILIPTHIQHWLLTYAILNFKVPYEQVKLCCCNANNASRYDTLQDNIRWINNNYWPQCTCGIQFRFDNLNESKMMNAQSMLWENWIIWNAPPSK
jgi:hypothetical protein